MEPLETPFWRKGLQVAGVDEAGRGAWAGPIVVGAVVLPPGVYPFRDSKLLGPEERARLAEAVRRVALALALGVAEVAEVDRLGPLGATLLAAERALALLNPPPEALVTDYLRVATSLPLFAPPRADRHSPSVAAASILAKVYRDRLMEELDHLYPGYGFARHKGYGTPEHREALARLGPSPVHRKRYAPVAQAALRFPEGG
ncbi:ribonuclease HII [Thermus thermamylovorans]|uniref:Ribonuclease HII n=1 Tax=Thermus thermamylovorans TaxID=2509362 RepID=A0A4Q9B4I4_9DEIN|nr:ribonuclease HII [Thermus thermamylovorans]TBH20848.1 ribonuclease HII [Thermus thermamylovorans]